jgi:hypothetical protein
MSSGAPTEHGTPIRNPAVALLCANSDDAYRFNSAGYRTDRNTPATLLINKQAPLLFGYMTRVALTEVNLAWATPNVNARNNTLTIGIKDITGADKGIYRVSIAESFYTPIELASALESALENLSISGENVGWTVTYIPYSSVFQIDIGLPPSSTVYYWKIVPPNASYTIVATATENGPGGVYTGLVNDDLTYMMGLTPPADSEVLYYDAITSGFASMQYTPYIDIVSSILTKNQNVRDGDTSKGNVPSKLARIYLSQPGCNNLFDVDASGNVTGKCNIVGCRPFILNREFNTPKVISWNTTENVDIIDIQVLDRLGFPIYVEPFVINSVPNEDLILGNTASFQFTLQATET